MEFSLEDISYAVLFFIESLFDFKMNFLSYENKSLFIAMEIIIF